MAAIPFKNREKDLVVAFPQANDVYIVEYPKSGITWLTTILAHLALDASGLDSFEPTFANLRAIIPDIHLGRDIGKPIYSNPPLRFIKSHSAFNPHYKLAVYLVRHPEKVANSYYRYLTARGHIDVDFSAFLRDPKLGIQSWCNHIDSWLAGKPKGGILHLLRYEDLMEDADGQIAFLCKNLGWKVSADKIAEAVRKSSVEAMKASEAIFLSHDPRYRAGFVKSKAVEIPESDKEYIRTTCARQIELLNYDG